MKINSDATAVWAFVAAIIVIIAVVYVAVR